MNQITHQSQSRIVKFYDQLEDGSFVIHYHKERATFDDEHKILFLNAFKDWGSKAEACRLAGTTPTTVDRHFKNDPEFAEAYAIALDMYKSRLIRHHQNLIFEGVKKKSYDRDGNLISETTEYPIRLIELELKKHDPEYRDKREVNMNVQAGVIIAPAELSSPEAWEQQFGDMKTMTHKDYLAGQLIEGQLVNEGQRVNDEE